MVLDRVERLVLDALGVAGGAADLEQRGIEELLLGLGMDLEEGRESGPHRGKRVTVRGVDLLEHREQPALLVMVVEDELGDVHAVLLRCGAQAPARPSPTMSAATTMRSNSSAEILPDASAASRSVEPSAAACSAMCAAA